MDVKKLFKLPELPSAAVNKRKWSAPKPDDSASSSSTVVEAGPSSPDPRPAKAARVDDDDLSDATVEDDTHFFSDDDQEDGRFFGGGLTAEQSTILDIMDRAPSPTSSQNDLPGLRKQLLRFERAINRNAEMRVKHATDPARFIDSEADLDAELKGLLVLTTQPAVFYGEFVRLGGPASLVGLLSHENADIAAAAIEVIEELTDEDVLTQGEDEDASQAGEAMTELVEALLKQSLLDLLVSNLGRFHDVLDAEVAEEERAAKAIEAENDAQAIYHTLGAIENLISSGAVGERLVAETSFLSWTLSRLAAKRPIDQNTSYTAEILAILLQTSPANRSKLGSTKVDDETGIDVLLSVLARYRRTPPTGAEEEEFVENIVDCLCLSLSESDNKRRFLDGEGVELMVLLMKEKRSFARVRAVKVLDHAMSGSTGAGVAGKIVEAKGLNPLFGVFGECGEDKRRKGATVTLQDAEHILGIVGSLLTHLPSESMERLRVLAQFVKDDYAGLDHLLDLRETLVGRVGASAGEEEEDEEEEYLARLERGLFSLQLLDTVLAWVVMEDDACKDHVKVMLRRQGLGFADVTATLREYRENVGDQLAVEGEQGEEGLRTSDILTALIEYLESL
ncbi:Beta-catenin-like protein 1, N-terminal [Kalmanozyma brasiliensis GHG001]|uniref:Beta-catenin-like protein 1 N-terminal domain-containing protein n=1 Tax=Kalmanozyma brasiliensis (strain GHG001) TaxID=1365824 RepID=V5EM15_KALBG|nr:Beta-catenin-like protein 1, N-terminal [Kalmanozyma brasiliensis GHG001]EST06150.1 Beta-catenin-like protein 1, N-terminal [Kalmanozyma brasiliensis GHG001]